MFILLVRLCAVAHHSVNSWLSVYGQFEAVWTDYGKQNVDPSNPTVIEQSTGYEFYAFPALLAKLGKGFGINFSLGGLDYGVAHVHKFGTVGQSFGLNFGGAILVGIFEEFWRTFVNLRLMALLHNRVSRDEMKARLFAETERPLDDLLLGHRDIPGSRFFPGMPGKGFPV